MKTPVTAERLKNHLTYSWWKYLVGIAAVVLVWTILFSVTATKAAPDEKIELYVYGPMMEDYADLLMEELRERAFPEQAEFIAYVLPPDTTSALQAYTIRVAMGDGDLLVIPREIYQNFAQEGLLADLGAMEEVMASAEAAGITIEPSLDWWSGSDGERRCYGIPVGQVAVLNALMGGRGADCYLSIRINNGNDAVSAQVLARILTDWTEDGQTYAMLHLPQ